MDRYRPEDLKKLAADIASAAGVPRADAEILADSLVAAGNGLGQVQAFKTLERLIPMAKTHGTAVATVRNSQHFGAVSYYCNLAADQDMILLATTNCEPAMSPAGGREPYFGTNP